MIANDGNRQVGVSEEDVWFVNTYCVQFVCFFGIQESIMYVKESNEILFCITFFRPFCSFNQYGEWHVTMVLMFFLCISDFTNNKTQMLVILFIDYSCIFVSFCLSIFILSVSTYSVIHMGLSTLEQFLLRFLYTVLLCIFISYELILVLIYTYRFENICLQHTYHNITVYWQHQVITLF